MRFDREVRRNAGGGLLMPRQFTGLLFHYGVYKTYGMPTMATASPKGVAACAQICAHPNPKSVCFGVTGYC